MTLTCSGLGTLGIPGNGGCDEQQGQGLKGSRNPLLHQAGGRAQAWPEAHSPLQEEAEARKLQPFRLTCLQQAAGTLLAVTM